DLFEFRIGARSVDVFHFKQREVALAVFRGTNLTGDGVAGTQVESTNLRRADVDIVGTRKIVVVGSAQESETVRQGFEYAFSVNDPSPFRLCLQKSEDQFLLAHAARAVDAQFFGLTVDLRDAFVF